jgi:hypothetical protein
MCELRSLARDHSDPDERDARRARADAGVSHVAVDTTTLTSDRGKTRQSVEHLGRRATTSHTR